MALTNDSKLIEISCRVFAEAWNRQLPELPCPKKCEDGRLFIRSVHRIPGSGEEEEWVEDTRVTPKAIWREFERYIKWLALGKPHGLNLGPLNLSLEDIPTIPALTFLGIGPREELGGFIENRHRCRPSTPEELQRPDPDPIGGLLKVLSDLGVDWKHHCRPATDAETTAQPEVKE